MTLCPGPEHSSECDNMACRRHGCFGGGGTPGSRMAARPLPRPDVNVVQTEDGKDHLVISRDRKAKSYPTRARPRPRSAVGKVINDRHTGEWLP